MTTAAELNTLREITKQFDDLGGDHFFTRTKLSAVLANATEGSSKSSPAQQARDLLDIKETLAHDDETVKKVCPENAGILAKINKQQPLNDVLKILDGMIAEKVQAGSREEAKLTNEGIKKSIEKYNAWADSPAQAHYKHERGETLYRGAGPEAGKNFDVISPKLADFYRKHPSKTGEDKIAIAGRLSDEGRPTQAAAKLIEISNDVAKVGGNEDLKAEMGTFINNMIDRAGQIADNKAFKASMMYALPATDVGQDTGGMPTEAPLSTPKPPAAAKRTTSVQH